MNIHWTNSSVSGLCDRLVDIVLLGTLAKYNNSHLYFHWKVFQNGGRHSWSYDQNQTKWWNEIRFQDYLYENFSQYFSLPDYIKVNQSPNNHIAFDNYLGGCYSPQKFKNIYNIDDYERFRKDYIYTLSQIKPTDKLLNIVSSLTIPDVTVHLRRGDKIRIDNDGWSIKPNEVDALNSETFLLIEKLKNENLSIYICSDDEEEKNIYEDKFNTVNKNLKTDYIYEKTYVDIYLMMKSKFIVMSQIHSNFSLFGSLLGGSTLIEMYEDKDRQTFSDIIDINYYKKYLEK